MKAPLAVLYWLTLLLGASNAQDGNCFFSADLAPSETYYIYNAEYPSSYRGRKSCLWTMRSAYNIQMNCSLQMPWSLNCLEDQLVVEVSSSAKHRYCGEGTFSIESGGPTMSVQFQSSIWSPGGKFLCSVTALKPPQDNENCRCGWKNPSRIVGGTETGVNEYPMMCALVDLELSAPFCGCTIIYNKYVVTAGHCLYNRNITNIIILVGDHDYEIGSDTNASAIYGIQRTLPHPNYDAENNINDIALIQVKGEIKFNDRVGPACLPFQHSPDTFGGDRVTALGWGATEFGGAPSTTLQQVQMSVMTNLQCKKNYPKVSVDQLCTYEKDKDSCAMDSGGPILWENPTSHNVVLVGVINYGVGCALKGSVNARVGAYVDWIAEATSDANYCIIE
ncbi:venom serine protease 34 [Lasioglossum baleicum]|uniref:venom serine protease 34 n=1 Tax=Lasioglossum baleicum TaxID=434251 RepID=UPI003FCDABF7